MKFQYRIYILCASSALLLWLPSCDRSDYERDNRENQRDTDNTLTAPGRNTPENAGGTGTSTAPSVRTDPGRPGTGDTRTEDLPADPAPDTVPAR